MLLAVCSIFALSIAAPFLHRIAKDYCAPLLALLPGCLCCYFLSLAPAIASGDPIIEKWEWVPSLGANLTFYVDGLSLLFAILVTGIGTLILLFAGGYFKGVASSGRFFSLLLLFMGAMLGIVISDNLFALFVFWELTSISSYLLIGYNHKDEVSRSSALQALIVTGGGGLALLAAFVLLGLAAGSFEISGINQMGSDVLHHALYPLILIGVLIGAFTKSAQFPFHFWLPNAMAAPAPVSAYLHSATMVKAGVFLLARLHPSIADSPAFLWTASAIGGMTMFLGAIMGAISTDMKRMLAYTTVSILGCLTLLLGIGTNGALFAFGVLVLGHALYKGTLFLVAGTVEKVSGERDVRNLGGLASRLPVLGVAASFAALSMIGVPLFFGFVAKEAIYEAALYSTKLSGLWLTVMIASSALFVIVAILVGIKPFIGPAVRDLTVKAAPTTMLIGPALLSLLGAVCFFIPTALGKYLIHPASVAVIGGASTITLKSWHGFNVVFGLSLLTIGLGVTLYLGLPKFRHFGESSFGKDPFGAMALYERSLAGVLRFGQWQAGVLQNGYLRKYILVTVCVTTAFAGIVFILHTNWSSLRFTFDLRVHEAALIIVMVAAVAILVRASSRLTAIVALGVLGYAVALVFMLYGAPDLTMTQLCIETLSVVLFVFVLYRLPQFIRLSRRRTRVRDGIIASSVGALMACLVLVASSEPADSHLRQYYSAKAYEEAFGRNVVNVILVDFRALDTLGEITVLAVAAIGVFALLKLRPPADTEESA
jgi:multicomponent Na+:H+ antiporter subunit A